VTDLTHLSCLDFNAIHCGDPVARAYFERAAKAIRLLEREAEHWRMMAAIERGGAHAARANSSELRKKLAALATPTEAEG
jgi:hypothetical protein